MIRPTLGRVVWFTPYDDRAYARGNDGRCAAIVTYVHSDRLVNLTVFTANGGTAAETSVQLLQDDDARPKSGFCEWMPYQQGQAAKAEAIEKQLAVK